MQHVSYQSNARLVSRFKLAFWNKKELLYFVAKATRLAVN
jgi:hypothetical protein